MAKTWRVANGHLVTGGAASGEKDEGAAASKRATDGQSAASESAASPVVVLLRSEEAGRRALSRAQHEVLSQLEHASMPFLECLPSGAAGLVVTPSGGRRFAFVLDANKLLLVDDGDLCSTALGRAVEDRQPVEGSAGALCALLRELLRDHPARLSRMREDFERLEAQVLEGRERPDRGKMMADTRRMLGLDTFYQGMSDLVGELSEGETGLVVPADRARLRSLARMLGRLSARLESLQDYSLQVHSLYQESIDLQQNSVMQWLTVVATIAMPLTFITGWYGMNFPHMALLDVPWGYAAVVVACVVLAAAEIAFFWYHGWLSFGGRRRRGR